MPMIVKLRNVVTAASSRLLEIEVAVAAVAAAGAVLTGEGAVVDPDEDVATGRPFRRRAGGRHHSEVVEVVDLGQLGKEAGPGELGSGRSCRLGEEPTGRPAEGGEDVGLVAGVDLVQPGEE